MRTFALSCLAFMLGLWARCPKLLLQAQPWAEDGSVFISRALGGNVLSTYAGYFHGVPQVAWYLALKFFPEQAPHICALLNLFLAALVPAYLLLPHWEVMLRFRWRLLCALALAFAQPHSEVYLGILDAYLHLTLGVALLLVEAVFLPQERQRFRLAKTFYLLLAGLSSPGPLQVGLGFGVYALLGSPGSLKDRLALLKRVLLVPEILLLLAVLALQTLLMLTDGGDRLGGGEVSWFSLPVALIHVFHMRIVAAWLLPDLWLFWVNKTGALSVGFLVITLFFAGAWAKAARYVLWLRLLVCIVLVYMALYFVARPEFYYWFTRKLWDMPVLGARAWYIPGALALVAWAKLSQEAKSRWARTLVFAGWLAIAGQGAANFRFDVFARDVRWSEVLGEIRAYERGEKNPLRIPINPETFFIEVSR